MVNGVATSHEPRAVVLLFVAIDMFWWFCAALVLPSCISNQMPPVGPCGRGLCYPDQENAFLCQSQLRKTGFIQALYFVITWMSCTSRPGDVSCAFLDSVKLVRYLVELKFIHQCYRSTRNFCVHIFIYQKY